MQDATFHVALIMQYYIITFGCQMNKSDSERIAAVLKEIGYKKASKINEADLIVVNMCSVRQSAVDRIYGLAPEFKKLRTKNSALKTLLTGCILKQDVKKFKGYFDYILAIKTLTFWKGALAKKSFCYYPDPRSLNFNQKFDAYHFKTTPFYRNNFSAFVPISTGCDNFCSYCVVPYTRGPLVCRPVQEILDEVKNLAEKGFKEIWLLGQNVNSYESGLINFAELLKMVNDIEGDFWVSFTSSHPKGFPDDLIKAVAECDKVNKYISLPIQAGDDKVLKRMNRPHTVAQYKVLIKKIRQAIPNVCLSTDVIVGFPGETKKQFEETVKLFEEIKFDMAYIAEYSPRPIREYKKGSDGRNYRFSNGARPETAALKMEDNVLPEEKQRRREVLTEVLKKTAIENNKKYIGKTVDVLIHERTKKGALVGKTRFYKTVKIPCDPKCDEERGRHIGEIVKVKIVDAMPWGLKGELN